MTSTVLAPLDGSNDDERAPTAAAALARLRGGLRTMPSPHVDA